MKNKSLINEVFWLRCVACLAVTLGHALQKGNIQFTEPTYLHIGSYVLYTGVLFGVPVFVFISEFLLSNKYATKVPPGFIRKRLKILLIPYVFISIVYALLDVKVWTFQNVFVNVVRNIFLGETTVYFILIIFQFYLLHILFSGYLSKLSAKVVLPTTFAVNFLYLAFFNFVEAPNNAIAHYIWNPGYWMPFVGWIFYFVLGYYCGKYYQTVLGFLRKHHKLVLMMPFITLFCVFLMNKYFTIDQSSKRIDILLFSSSMIFAIMYLSTTLNKTPKLIMIISNYSFSIFLLNEFFFIILLYLEPPAFLNILSYSFLALIISLLASIGTAYVLNKFRFGKYFGGQVMDFKVENVQKVKIARGLGKTEVSN